MTDALRTSFHEWLVDLRRHFHQIPELAYREQKTASKIAGVLDELRVPFQAGVGRTGLVASVVANCPGPTLAMRADMDALPLDELSDVDYRSIHPGVMHACGHDAHVTIQLGVIRWLLENKWPEKGAGKILFFFQPAEEGGGGARSMIESGVLDGEYIEAIFAGHVHPELPAGHIGLAPETSNAASDTIRIRLRGFGCHGAQPHLCVDPIVAGAQLITQLQTIVSRDVPATESAVLTIGRFQAGTASNIIPKEAVLEGTIRTLRPSVRQKVIKRLEEMLGGMETAFNLSAELTVVPGYPLLVNNPRIVEYIVNQAGELLGETHVHRESPRMGAEDFAYFLEKWSGALIRLGCHDPEKGFTHGLHSPHFDLDENVLDVGVLLFATLLTRYGSCETS